MAIAVVLVSVVALGCGAPSELAGPSGATGAADAGAPGDEGSEESSADAGPADGTPLLDEEGPSLPTWDELEPGWNEIRPERGTTCSRDTPYAFFFRPGTVDRLLVEFEGGGACWDKTTCSVAEAIFKEDIEQTRQGVQLGYAYGIYDRENPDNPFKDWSHLYVPYCTGDIHSGESVMEYATGPDAFTIHHKGAVNTRVALGWVRAVLASVDQAFVTGCSAGAYGAIFWAPFVAKYYPEASVVQMGDSGAGIITETFMRDSFPVWQTERMLPEWIPGLNPAEIDVLTLTLPDVYSMIGSAYPAFWFSQFNRMADETQAFYFEAMGGSGADEWSGKMTVSMTETARGSENFRYYVAPGDDHCIIPFDSFYTTEVDGQRLVDWIGIMLEGQDPGHVACEGCVE